MAKDYNNNPHRHKTILLKGRKATFEATTNGNGMARVSVSNGDTYTIWCDGITGEFECDQDERKSWAIPHDAGSGSIELTYEDNRFDLKGVNFNTGKADLLPSSFKILESTVKGLQKFDTVRVEISGHTDTDGGLEYNDKLSQARAESVRNYLIKKGIAESRITAVGYGYSRPRANNNTPQGKAQNRRIEIMIIP